MLCVCSRSLWKSHKKCQKQLTNEGFHIKVCYQKCIHLPISLLPITTVKSCLITVHSHSPHRVTWLPAMPLIIMPQIKLGGLSRRRGLVHSVCYHTAIKGNHFACCVYEKHMFCLWRTHGRSVLYTSPFIFLILYNLAGLGQKYYAPQVRTHDL